MSENALEDWQVELVNKVFGDDATLVIAYYMMHIWEGQS